MPSPSDEAFLVSQAVQGTYPVPRHCLVGAGPLPERYPPVNPQGSGSPAAVRNTSQLAGFPGAGMSRWGRFQFIKKKKKKKTSPTSSCNPEVITR